MSGGWNSVSSADRERFSERLKLYVSNINRLCDDLLFTLTVPGYANIGRNLMSTPQITAFTEHLTRLLQTLDEHEKMAAVTMHYLILYAVFERWPQVDVLKAAYENASVQPESEPVELALVGLADYNGVVRLLYGAIIGIVVYRIVSIIAVFIINLLYRRRNAKKAAALRAGNFIP